MKIMKLETSSSALLQDIMLHNTYLKEFQIQFLRLDLE